MPLQNSEKMGIESSDGIARTFDDSSDGTGFGEGVAAVLLKPLSKAIEDCDNIYAVIKGSAVNQDGFSISLTAPSPEAQSEVIIRAWRDAGVQPGTITYINAKIVEKYRNFEVFGETHEAANQASRIVKEWTLIRTALTRFIYTSHYKQLSGGNAMSRLKEICRLEEKYLQTIFMEHDNCYISK